MTIGKHRISFESLFELNVIKDWEKKEVLIIQYSFLDLLNTVCGLLVKNCKALPENNETTKMSVKLWFKLHTVFLPSWKSSEEKNLVLIETFVNATHFLPF